MNNEPDYKDNLYFERTNKMQDRFKLKDIYYKTEVVKTSTNNNWKGGVYVAGGYAKVKVKEHPAKDKRGYVLLHRLVMEDYLGRYLKDDEFIHHKDGDKLNNDLSNLELVYPEKHAKEHYIDRNIDKKTGQFVCSEPKFNEIMFRLYDKDRNCTKEYTLSKLIYTKFKRNKFEYRGMSTGLKDKNGKLIYEGDICRITGKYWDCEDAEEKSVNEIDTVKSLEEFFGEAMVKGIYTALFCETLKVEVIGNIHENADLLEVDNA